MPDDFLTLTLHASEFPERRRAGLLAALGERRVPAQALYLSLAQAQRWLTYHAAWSPSRTDAALQALYGAAYDAATALLPAGEAMLVGLGCGGGTKDAELAARLAGRAGRAPLHYAPVDASPALVAEAARRVRERGADAGGAGAGGAEIGVHPLVADLSGAPALEGWLRARAALDPPRVLSCFGLLPNMNPSAFPRWLAALLRPQDVLLLSANLSPGGLDADGPRILMQYDNPQARAWYGGALAELGLSRSDYALVVQAQPLALEGLAMPPGAAWRIVVVAVLLEDVSLGVQEAEVALSATERLTVFQSLRFTADAAQALLAAAGLRVARRWVGAGGEEGLFLCRRA